MSVETFRAADGTRLAFERVGSGPLLVCQPGGPGRAAAYLEDLGGLSATRTLVRLDARGSGRSEVPPDPASMRVDRLADDIDALRDHLGVDRMDLLGHSAGTLVALLYAAQHSDRVDHLILVTPSGKLLGVEPTDLPALRAARSSEPWYAETAAAADDFTTAPPAMQQQLSRLMRPFYYGRWDDRTAAHAATADTQMSPRAVAAFGAGIEPEDISARLAGLREMVRPVLVVAGERDAMTGVVAAQAAVDLVPNGQLAVIPRAGHFPWIDEPAEFAAAVEEFLAAG